MDQLYELVLDNLVCYSHTINFPEMVTPAIHQVVLLDNLYLVVKTHILRWFHRTVYGAKFKDVLINWYCVCIFLLFTDDWTSNIRLTVIFVE